MCVPFISGRRAFFYSGGEKLDSRVEKAKVVIAERASDKKISCSEARNIAEEMGVPLRIIGDLCNELKIRIYACELGCFK